MRSNNSRKRYEKTYTHGALVKANFYEINSS